MATVFCRRPGTVAWLKSSLPQLATVPSFLRARLCWPPAAMAMTPLRPPGAPAWPKLLSPHPVTVPLPRRARLWAPPAETATMSLRLAGGAALTYSEPFQTSDSPQPTAPTARLLVDCEVVTVNAASALGGEPNGLLATARD